MVRLARGQGVVVTFSGFHQLKALAPEPLEPCGCFPVNRLQSARSSRKRNCTVTAAPATTAKRTESRLSASQSQSSHCCSCSYCCQHAAAGGKSLLGDFPFGIFDSERDAINLEIDLAQSADRYPTVNISQQVTSEHRHSPVTAKAQQQQQLVHSIYVEVAARAAVTTQSVPTSSVKQWWLHRQQIVKPKKCKQHRMQAS